MNPSRSRRRPRYSHLGALLLAAELVLPAVTPLCAFELIGSTPVRSISPQITSNPIQVVIWVKTGVTPANETRVLDLIRQGLQMWEDVPTSRIRFQIVDIVHAATDPGKQSHQMEIIIGNQADLTSGGASFPFNGNPGTWFGAVADVPAVRLVEVTVHEVGHAMGFAHSTISVTYPVERRPIMHFAVAATTILQDDIAAISSVYPQDGMPLSSVTGSIRGRLVSADATKSPVSGVSVVAMSSTTKTPVVARVSGGSGVAGTFELVGLPPATYQLFLKDGHDYLGSFVGLGSALGLGGGFQADCFEEPPPIQRAVATGQSIDLGDLQITLLPLSVDGMFIGQIGSSSQVINLVPASSVLPPARVKTAYEVWLHLRGGLRDLTAQATGLPSGLAANIAVDPRSANVGVHGSQFVRIVGSPQQPGTFPIHVTVTDGRGISQNLTFTLTVMSGKHRAVRR